MVHRSKNIDENWQTSFSLILLRFYLFIEEKRDCSMSKIEGNIGVLTSRLAPQGSIH